MILQGKEGTVIQEAISGLYLIATGIASISSSDLVSHDFFIKRFG
jgi:hypothetical protein